MTLRTYLLLALSASAVSAATYPAGFSEELVASGLNAPAAMAFAPDGRLFVCEQAGNLRVIKNGLTVSSIGERGLLGVAFDPNSSTNNRVYVYYTTAGTPIHNRVSRFTANGDFAPSNTETDDRTVLEDFVLTLTRP